MKWFKNKIKFQQTQSLMSVYKHIKTSKYIDNMMTMFIGSNHIDEPFSQKLV